MLLGALKDPDPRVRAVAARGSASPPPPGAADALAPLLKDPVPAVRAEAAITLGALGDARALGVLGAGFAAAPEAGEALRLAASLGAIGTAEVVAPLLARVADSDALVRSAVLSALARVRPAPAFDPRLAERASDAAVHVRTDLAALLGHMKGQRPAGRLLEGLLRDKDDNVRFAAASALAVLADPTTITPLRRARATDSSERVRQAAGRALGALPGADSPSTDSP